jgi:polyisoprenoid-binding protein YceI
VRGVIDIDKSTFAFEVRVSAFEGFNSPLQKEHFNENYMETAKYPYARFFGKMIGKFDPNVIGTYTVEAVETLDIHGVKKERQIEVTIEVGSDKALDTSSQFDILLDDHNIKVPSIVRQKIAETISIDFSANLITKAK